MAKRTTFSIKGGIILPLFLFLISNFGMSQGTPAVFKLNINQIPSEIESFLTEYKVSTSSFRDSVFTDKINAQKRQNNEFIRNVEGNIIYVYFYGAINPLPQERDVIRFSLKKKSSNEKMNIYIRIAHNMDFGEEFELTNLIFQPGDFFLDKCKSKKKHQVSNTPTSEVNLLKLRKYKISIKKLNRILKKR